ncbi:Spherulation-specific family 4 [Mycena metata]|uniref:Spherulation-specific family 4 n=1 Tax=Mycena metata TaxID=1033252 RepID=A0AAD7IHY9_9AGAR|nr:Spherulation-specific family 4 [Mycena metata]
MSLRKKSDVPLYSYPETTATWAPLETAISNFPNVQFYVIVNPDSGPGDAGSQPDTNYQAGVTALRTHANVVLLGYVYTSYGDRLLADVQQDIATYAGWRTAYSLAGIFFDETQQGLTSTYTAYAAAARSAAWPGRTTGYVILNPGEDIGSSNYYSIADQIVTFEDTYAEYEKQAPLPLPHPAQQSVIIHTFTGTSATLLSVVQSLQKSGFLSTYITNLNIATTDVYGSFGSDFSVFAQDVSA